MRANLRVSVAIVLAAAVISPFVYFSFRAADVLEYAARHYHFFDALFAVSIALVFFASVANFPRFARWCARDRDRVADTIRHATVSTCILTLCFLLLLAAVLFGR
jgi:hypothetical protein